MRITLMSFLCCATFFSNAQPIDSLNTAKHCAYMTIAERAMICEINLVRSDPRGYIQYIAPLLADAKKELATYGKGAKNYSLTFSSSTRNGVTKERLDTTWHYISEENVKALSSLIGDLKKIKKLSVLKPDTGIYHAARIYAADEHEHEWKLIHEGSDGSYPWDRIRKYSPSMSFGNENIAMMSGDPSVRDIVILLLVDAGIPGYGHRDNILDPQWTHIACTTENYKSTYNWWLQEFGVRKKN